MIKFKNEWPLMLETARANRLSVEETVLLFAIREVEAGKKGNEFNKQNVQNTSLAVQADSMALQIQKGEFIYQKYLKGQFQYLELKPNETPISFLQFLGQQLMPNEGQRKDACWIKQVEEKIVAINTELGDKNANN